MSRIVMVRHGETVWHEENRYAGRSDIALTPKGQEQANKLARWATTAGVTAVWSSPLSRARNTAVPAAKALGLPLQIDERLTELDFGKSEGLTSVEMAQRIPEEYAAFRLDPVTNFLPGGEDPAHAMDRAIPAIYAIAGATAPGSRSLIVAHNTLLRLVLCHLLGISLSRYRAVFPLFDNCSLTEIDLSPGKDVSLLHFNAPLLL
jgi:broad specificity phosphatase PhoE